MTTDVQVDRYNAVAKLMREKATRIADPTIQSHYLDLALQYENLAEAVTRTNKQANS